MNLPPLTPSVKATSKSLLISTVEAVSLRKIELFVEGIASTALGLTLTKCQAVWGLVALSFSIATGINRHFLAPTFIISGIYFLTAPSFVIDIGIAIVVHLIFEYIVKLENKVEEQQERIRRIPYRSDTDSFDLFSYLLLR